MSGIGLLLARILAGVVRTPEVLFNRGRRELTKLDLRVMADLREKLGPKDQEVFDRQLEDINLVSRLTGPAGEHEVVLQRFRWPLVVRSRDCYFKVSGEEVLAKADYELGGKRFRVSLIATDGVLYGLVYSRYVSNADADCVKPLDSAH